MLDLLKEMGRVCENRRIGELLVRFHRKRFDELYLWDKKRAEMHRRSYAFWSARLADMNKHINQLHERIKAA